MLDRWEAAIGAQGKQGLQGEHAFPFPFSLRPPQELAGKGKRIRG